MNGGTGRGTTGSLGILGQAGVAISLVVISVLFLGCSDKRATPSDQMGQLPDDLIDHSYLDPRKISGKLLATEEIFGKLAAISWDHDGVLWIGDLSGDPYLHNLDPERGTLIRSVGLDGEGPGDFRNVWDIYPLTGSGGVWVHDNTLSRVTQQFARDSHRTGRIIELPATPRLLVLGSLGGGFVGWSVDTAARLTFLDSVGSVRATAPGPLLGADTIPFRQRMVATAQMKICGKPDGSRFAIALASAGRIEIRDADGSLLLQADVPFASAGDFGTDSRGNVVHKRVKRYYFACDATNDVLLAAFSGMDERMNPEGNAWRTTNKGWHLHAFDWDGRLVGTWQTDVPLTRIAWDAEGGRLYATEAETGSVYAFDLEAPGNNRDTRP